MKRPIFSGLWQHSDFRKLWIAHTIAQFGAQISGLAIPLAAVILLDASAAQMGVMLALVALPALLVGLFIGVWVDRLQRRPLLIAADLGRAVVLVAVPILAVTDQLRIEHLYVIAFLQGTLRLLFNVAYRSYLPSLISRDQLVDGNSKLELSRSASDIAGPGMAGGLVQLITAPFAVLLHVVGLLFSALFLSTIRAAETTPERDPDRRVWREVRDGLRFVVRDRVLRALAGCAVSLGFFSAVVDVVILLYIVDELGVSAGLLGLIFSAGNIGFLIGALMPQRLVHWIGLGPALGLGLVITGVGDLIIPLASGPSLLLLATLAAGQLMFGAGITVFRINEVSLRQALTPDRMQGRMNATMSMMLQGVVPAGALVGGILGTTLGLRTTFIMAAIGEMLIILWLVLSPIWSMKRHPLPIEPGLESTPPVRFVESGESSNT